MASIDTYFKSKYLKVDDLEGKPFKVTIKDVGEFAIEGEDPKPTLLFKESEKELALNKTNCNILADLMGSRDMDDWIGHKIKIYPTKTEYQGKRVPCIRVNDEFHEAPTSNGKQASASSKPKRVQDDSDEDPIPF